MFKFSPYVGLESPTRHAGSVGHVVGLRRVPSLRHVVQVRHVLFVLAACFVLSSSIPLLAQSDEISWFTNYDEAIREAKRTGKPIFLEFRCES